MSEELRFPGAMSSWDALMWRIEGDPVLRSTTSAVTLLEKPPRREVLAARLQGAAREIPRLRQRVVEPPRALSNPVWVDDPHFDLDYHLRWIRAPRDGSLRALLDHAAALAMQAFDRDRALWEFVVVEDLADGRAALLQKLHHAVTDGVAGVRLMERVYDRAPDTAIPDAAPPAPSAGDAPGALRLGLEVLGSELAAAPRRARQGARAALRLAREPLRGGWEALAGLAGAARMLRPPGPPLSPLLQGRSARYRFETLEVPLPALKAAAHAAGCKLNDAYLAALCGGWRRYHEAHGAPVKALRIHLPINLRSAGSAAVAGNRLALARVLVPVGLRDPLRRMRAIRRLVAAERSRPGLGQAQLVAGLINALPDALLGLLAGRGTRGVDFVASCVPGPREPLYLAGARVTEVFPFGPTAGAAANLTLFSYGGVAQVTLNADPAAIPDPGVLAGELGEGFAEVLAVTGGGLR